MEIIFISVTKASVNDKTVNIVPGPQQRLSLTIKTVIRQASHDSLVSCLFDPEACLGDAGSATPVALMVELSPVPVWKFPLTVCNFSSPILVHTGLSIGLWFSPAFCPLEKIGVVKEALGSCDGR